MTTTAAWIVHTAAPPVSAIQRCATCGFVLEDWTAALEGRVMTLNGDNQPLPWWPVGQMIAVSGPAAITLPQRPLEADERLCAGAN